MTTKPPNRKGKEPRLLSIKRRRANWQTPRHKPLPRQLERPLQDRGNAHLGLDIDTGQLICLRPRVITRTVTRGMAGPSATPPACRSRDAPPAERLQAAHALTFVRPQVEQTVVGRSRQVDFIERDAGSMQKHRTADPAQASADRPIHLDGIVPCRQIAIPHVSPHGVAVERASNAGALRWIG